MPKLPKRLPFEIAIAAAMMLGSCSTARAPKLWTHDEIVDIADDVAADAVNDSEKVKDLTDRLEAVEQRLHIDE